MISSQYHLKLDYLLHFVYISSIFQAADRKDDSGGKNKDNVLDEDEFVDFYRVITEREELKDIFKR